MTTEIRNGDELIATVVCKLFPARSDIDEQPLYLESQVSLPDGRTFTRQPGNTWLTDEGKHLRELHWDLEASDDGMSAFFYLIAW